MTVAVTSCTYPDSFTSMGFGPACGIPVEPKPYHGQVFSIADLGAIVAAHGLPEDSPDQSYDGYQIGRGKAAALRTSGDLGGAERITHTRRDLNLRSPVFGHIRCRLGPNGACTLHVGDLEERGIFL